MARSWHLIEACIVRSLEEEISSWLFDLGTTGIVTTAESGDTVNIGAYFDQQLVPSHLTETIRNRLALVGRESELLELRITRIEDCDWMQKWKEGFNPIQIGNRLIVAPSWRLPEDCVDRIVIQIDPGMAFGTGTHETTRLCLEAVEQYWRGERLMDVGTGTGVLAIAAARLCSNSRILGIDIDPVAVEIASRNVEINGVAANVEIREASIQNVADGPFDVVVANLTAETILDQIDQFQRCLSRLGVLILSGILNDLSADVEQGLTRNGLAVVENRQDGDWTALVAQFT